MPVTYPWHAPESLGLAEFPDIHRHLAVPLYLAELIDDAIPRMQRALERFEAGTDPLGLTGDQAQDVVADATLFLKVRGGIHSLALYIVRFHRLLRVVRDDAEHLHRVCAGLLEVYGHDPAVLDPIAHRPHAVARRTRALLGAGETEAFDTEVAALLERTRSARTQLAPSHRNRRATAEKVELVLGFPERMTPAVLNHASLATMAIPRAAPGEPPRGTLQLPAHVQLLLAQQTYVLGLADARLTESPDHPHAARLRELRTELLAALEAILRASAAPSAQFVHTGSELAFRQLAVRIDGHFPGIADDLPRGDAMEAAAVLWSRLEAHATPVAARAREQLTAAMQRLSLTRPPDGPPPAPPDEGAIEHANALTNALFALACGED